MSSKIRVLSDTIINQIAAGEVIENTASVVKELIDNSLDAQATEITIEIKSGGRHLIRISDNGCGMNKDDAILCLERHATSKIRTFTDLEELVTMGFRGEAIPSIASISKFTLITSTGEENNDLSLSQATLVAVDGGNIVQCKPSIRSRGTTVEVKSLFFNVPVRKKFQKAPNYDVVTIHKVVDAFALAYPEIYFEFISDSKVIFKTSLKSDRSNFEEQLQERMHTILGDEFASSSLPISIDHPNCQLRGYISKPSYHRSNRAGQHLFINRRHIYSPLIAASIREGYGHALPSNRFPCFLLHLTVPGNLIDVNVHPQKKEVRLRQELLFKELLQQAVRHALVNCNPLPPFSSMPQTTFIPTLPWENSGEEDLAKKENELQSGMKETDLGAGNFQEMTHSWIRKDSGGIAAPSEMALPIRRQEVASELLNIRPSFQPPKILAVMPRYILIDATTLHKKHGTVEEGLYVVDQQVAYFRILYEQFSIRMRSIGSHEEVQEIQPLLIPYTLELSPIETRIAKEYLKQLQSLGIGIQEFGQNTFIINAVPQHLATENIHAIIVDLLDELRECEQTRIGNQEKERRLVQVASRAVLFKGNHRLTAEAAQQLVQKLLQCQEPYYCPLGKPTMVHITPQDLAKNFFK